MKSRMRLAAAAPALFMTGPGLIGCSGQVKETEVKTGAADKQTGSAQIGDTQEKGDQADDGQVKEGQTVGDKTYKVAPCLSGAANGMDWCQSVCDGLKPLETDYGCEVTYTGNLTPDDIEAAFADYAISGYDVVIGRGYEFGGPAVDIAEQCPDTKFIVTEGEVSANNMASYVSKCEEGGHIMKMPAAGTLESGKVSFIGPIQGTSLVKIMSGFEDGAKGADPGIQVQTVWTGSSTDMALGEETAQAMIDDGAGVIGHCANESGTGTISAAKEAKVYVTGDSHDQNDLVSDTILSSSVYHIPYVIEVAFRTIADRIFEGGIHQPGVADGAAGITSYHDLDSAAPDKSKQKISNKIAAIESGKFEAPCDTRPRA